jgi:2-C-methyl-D-erythritol 4-phosphate cytidylyltransferase
MDTVAIIVGAGGGTRLGGVCKPLIELAGKPMLSYSLELFQKAAEIDGICVAVPPDMLEKFRELYGGGPFGKIFRWVAGGRRRQDTVANALAALPGEVSWAVIHDAARPFATGALLGRVIREGQRSSAAVPAVPVADTIKEVGESGVVLNTLDRGRLRAVQTPQFFSVNLLRDAYRHATQGEIEVTDDASLVERIHGVAVVEGESENMKITTAHDLVLADCILRRRSL